MSLSSKIRSERMAALPCSLISFSIGLKSVSNIPPFAPHRSWIEFPRAADVVIGVSWRGHHCVRQFFFWTGAMSPLNRGHCKSGQNKRRDRDSNPGYPCGHSGFQDRCDRPLCHLSGTESSGSVGSVKLVLGSWFLVLGYGRVALGSAERTTTIGFRWGEEESGERKAGDQW